MSNLNGPGYCSLLIAHCSLLILARDATPTASQGEEWDGVEPVPTGLAGRLNLFWFLAFYWV